MSQTLTDNGRKGFLDGTLITTGTWKAMLVTLGTTATQNKAITACTGAASPITVTIPSHGYTNGDTVITRGIGGNTAANGTWRVANAATNTFDLQTVPAYGGTQGTATGNAAYTSGGTAINISAILASTDLSGARAAGSTDQTLTSVSAATLGKGIFTSASPTWTVNASTTIDAIVVYQSAATDRIAYITDQKFQIRVDSLAASSATTIIVEPLPFGIANGTVINFSNGSATLTAAALAGDRTLTVSALAGAIGAGHTADVQINNTVVLPLTTAAGSASNFTYTVDAVNGWFRI